MAGRFESQLYRTAPDGLSRAEINPSHRGHLDNVTGNTSGKKKKKKKKTARLLDPEQTNVRGDLNHNVKPWSDVTASGPTGARGGMKAAKVSGIF